MIRLWGTTCVFAFLLALSIANGVSQAAKPSPPAPPPPVKYVLQWLGPGLAWDMNEDGVIVGEAVGHATLYTAANGVEDLNSIGAAWMKLDGTPAPGWTAVKATGINSSGQVVGTAINGLGQARAFLMDDPFSPTPVFKLLPLDALAVGGRQAINDFGVVASPSAIDGELIVYVPTGIASYSLEFVNYPTGIGIGLSINNAGTIVGCSTNQPNGLGPPGMLFTPGQASNSMTIFRSSVSSASVTASGESHPRSAGISPAAGD